jgi:hypothetical protein
VDASTASALGHGVVPGIEAHIRSYLNGRDWVSTPRGVYVLDFFGLTSTEVQHRFPAAYQHLLTRAKPEREHNRNAHFRDLWWVIGHPRPQFRAATNGLHRYIVTVETQKHRYFGFVPAEIVPDSTLVTFAFSDATWLGLLSSRVHVSWTLAAGGTLEDRPRYNKTRCFETFPFPVCTNAQSARIGDLAEEIDAHRKRQQAQHPDVTLTGIYNVLEKLRSGETLTAKERTIHDHGLVSVLRDLHDDLDRAVFDAYGWNDLAAALVGRPGATTPLLDKPAEQAQAEEELLARLVRLNAERAAEEARGLVRWLRPEFQNPQGRQPAAPVQEEIETETQATASAGPRRRTWPAALPEQIRVVAEVVASSPAGITLDKLAAAFTGRGPWKKRLPTIVESLEALGRLHVERQPGGERYLPL